MRAETGTRRIESPRTSTLSTAPGCTPIFIAKRVTWTTPPTGTAAPTSRSRPMRSALNGIGLPRRCWLDDEGWSHETKAKEGRAGDADAHRVATAHAWLWHADRHQGSPAVGVGRATAPHIAQLLRRDRPSQRDAARHAGLGY